MSDIFKVKQNDQWVGIPALIGQTGPQGPRGLQGSTGPQGPQGIQGPQGPQGVQGSVGPTGDSAGFGTPTATAMPLNVGSNPTVSVSASGPDTEKVFNFTFGIPESGVSQADWDETDTSSDSYINNKPNLSTVATSGSYNDLSDKPDLTLKENVSNKVTSISSSSTDSQYPSAKCVFEAIQTAGSQIIFPSNSATSLTISNMEIGESITYCWCPTSSDMGTFVRVYVPNGSYYVISNVSSSSGFIVEYKTATNGYFNLGGSSVSLRFKYLVINIIRRS